MAHARPVLFECAKLFEVQESTPGAGGENPSHSFGEQVGCYAFVYSGVQCVCARALKEVHLWSVGCITYGGEGKRERCKYMLFM